MSQVDTIQKTNKSDESDEEWPEEDSRGYEDNILIFDYLLREADRDRRLARKTRRDHASNLKPRVSRVRPDRRRGGCHSLHA